jgi:hypothetical protein
MSVAPTTLFVSSAVAEGGNGTQSRPFNSLQQVGAAIREMRSNGNRSSITVRLRGTFIVSEPLKWGTEVSDTNWERWGRGPAQISGGTALSAWRPATINGRGAWVHSVPGSRYRQMWVAKERRPIAILPKKGFYRLTGLLNGAEKSEWNKGQGTAKFAGDDIRPFTNLTDVDFTAHHFWVHSRMRVASIDAGAKIVKFDRPSIFRLTDDYTEQAAEYRLENPLEGLTEPGEWIHDSKQAIIAYLPKSGEKIEEFTATVSETPQLLSVEGAKNLTIRGLEFRHSDWHLPPGDAGPWQAGWSIPAAIQLRDVTGCVLEECSVRQVGTYAVEFLQGSSADNAVRKCVFQDLGGGGVKVGHDTARTTIEDCVIQEGGRVYPTCVGVWIGNSGGNKIAHNRIHDLFYSGVSVGWTWGYAAAKTQGNIVEFNDISKIGQGLLSDMGGIYTLGDATGSVLRNNRIRDVDSRGYGGWGIYFDEGTTNMLAENNLVQNTKSGGFHQHYGKQNVLRNNVFMNARRDGQLIATRIEDHQSFTVERNVVVWTGTDAFGSNWGKVRLAMANNVYWRTDGEPTFAGTPFTQWQTGGRDAGSVVADPKITVTSRGVRFAPTSPATKLGILPIDLSRVGPRR